MPSARIERTALHWTCLQREIYEEARRKASRSACPPVVIMDGQSVKTTERGGVRGFDAHKRVKGRKRHILRREPGDSVSSYTAGDETIAVRVHSNGFRKQKTLRVKAPSARLHGAARP